MWRKMPDTKPFPTGSPKDSDDHSDKAAGKKPEQPTSEDDSASSSVDRRIESTVVLGNDTKKPSSDQTISLDGSEKAGQEARSDRTMVLGDDASTSKQPSNQTVNLESSNAAPPRRADDPMQTMVIGENEDLRDLISPNEDENKEVKKPDHKKTVTLDPNPPASRADDPMQTMVIGESQDLRDLISENPEAEEKTQETKPDRKKTVSLDPNLPASRANDPTQTMVIGENQDLRDLISENPEAEEKTQETKPDRKKTVSLDPNPPASRANDPMQTMVIGENQDLKDLISDEPEPEKKKDEKKPDHKKTVTLDPNPPASRADDPMQTMVIGENQDFRDLVSDKPEPDKKKEHKKPERPKTVALEPNPPSGRANDPNQTMVIGDDTNLRDLISNPKENKPVPTNTAFLGEPPTGSGTDPNQTMIIGENDDFRDLVSDKNLPNESGPERTLSLENNQPRSSSSKPSRDTRGETLALDQSKGGSSTGQSRPTQDPTATAMLGQGGSPAQAPGDVGSRTMPLGGNAPPQSGSHPSDSSGTMVLGGSGNAPPTPSNAPQDPRSKTVVLGNQEEASRLSGGEPGNRTMPLDGSSAPPRSGAQTAVLGNTGTPDSAEDARTKTVVLGQGQAARPQDSGSRTVPLGDLGRPAGKHPAAERSATEPIVPIQEESSPSTFGTFPYHVDHPNAPLEPRTSEPTPLRASTFGEAPRAGETRQAQLLRRTTSALAFTAMAILISILCATLSSSAVSLTYSCAVLSLFVGMFSFWRYTRLLRHLGTANDG